MTGDPAAALDTALRIGLKGPAFNAVGFGSYLIFRGVPIFIDGRIELTATIFSPVTSKRRRITRMPSLPF